MTSNRIEPQSGINADKGTTAQASGSIFLTHITWLIA
jgi:hypothetical protein